VGDLSVPDPRVVNPELFDLKNKEAPIPQFANALRNAGINLTPEEIAQGIIYVSTKKDGLPLVDKDGNPFVVAVYNLDPSLFPKEYRDLAGQVPLMIAKREDGDWKWENYREVPLRIFADATGISIGTNDEALDGSLGKKVGTHFNLLYAPWSFKWDENQPTIYSNNTISTNKFNYAQKTSMNFLGGVLVSDYPAWLINGLNNQSIDVNDLEQFLRRRVKEAMKPFGARISYWVVTNEVDSSWNRNDPVVKKLGVNKFLEIVYDEAHKNNPNAILIFNDSVNHFPPGSNGGYTELPKNVYLIRELRKKGYNVAVGLQMHLNQNQWSQMPTIGELKKAFEIYRQNRIPVVITEMDVSIYNVDPKQPIRFLYQAMIFQGALRAYLESGAGGENPLVSFWGLRDNESWLETWGEERNPNADPLLFDDMGNTKMAYYAILMILFENYLNKVP